MGCECVIDNPPIHNVHEMFSNVYIYVSRVVAGRHRKLINLLSTRTNNIFWSTRANVTYKSTSSNSSSSDAHTVNRSFDARVRVTKQYLRILNTCYVLHGVFCVRVAFSHLNFITIEWVCKLCHMAFCPETIRTLSSKDN